MCVVCERESVSVSLYVHVSTGFPRKAEEDACTGPRVKTVINYPMLVLGTKLRFSSREVHALNF